MTQDRDDRVRSVTINFRLTRDERGEVDGWAELEDRSRSDMARILLSEALATRKSRRRRRPPGD